MPSFRLVPGLAFLLACSTTGSKPVPTSAPPPAVSDDTPPLGKLPADVRPTRYALALEIDPTK